jgi:hypothetical protein
MFDYSFTNTLIWGFSLFRRVPPLGPWHVRMRLSLSRWVSLAYRVVLMLWHAFLFLGLRLFLFSSFCLVAFYALLFLVRNLGILLLHRPSLYQTVFLQEKAVEATKQKRRKEEKT